MQQTQDYSKQEKQYWDNRGVVDYVSLSDHDQKRIDEWIQWKGYGTVLDIGGGSGMISRLLMRQPDTYCICLDLSMHMLKHSPVTAVQADAMYLPFANESFDLVVAAAFFHHIPGQESSLLKECWRILKPGGRLIGYDPNAHCIQNVLFMTDGILRLKFFSPDELPIAPELMKKVSIDANYSHFTCKLFTFKNDKLTMFEIIQRFLINPFSIGFMKKYLDRWFFWTATK